jgi:hypothetical protein
MEKREKSRRRKVRERAEAQPQEIVHKWREPLLQ